MTSIWRDMLKWLKLGRSPKWTKRKQSRIRFKESSEKDKKKKLKEEERKLSKVKISLICGRVGIVTRQRTHRSLKVLLKQDCQMIYTFILRLRKLKALQSKTMLKT